MNKDNIWWELNQWIVPVWQEYISFKFIVTWAIGMLAVLLLTGSIVAGIGWFFGFLIFGTCLAAHEGIFDID